MGIAFLLVIAAVVVVAALIVAVVVVLSRRNSATVQAGRDAAGLADAPPMNGLENALAQVTDRTGRPIREAIDAEAGHVDDLRVPDDTGPLLRRALDHVTPPGGDTTNATPDPQPDQPDTPPTG